MIEVTVGNLLVAKAVLQELANTPMSAKDGFVLLKILKIIDEEYGTIDETTQKLIKKYGKVDEKGNLVTIENKPQIQEDKKEQFNQEYNEFLAVKLELDCPKIKPELLDKISITPNKLFFLEPFLDM